MKNIKKILVFSLLFVCTTALASVITWSWLGNVRGSGVSRPTTVNQTFNGWTSINKPLYENAPEVYGTEITNPISYEKYVIKGTYPLVIDTMTNYNIYISESVDTLILSRTNYVPGQIIQILYLGNNDSTIIYDIDGLTINGNPYMWFNDTINTSNKSVTLYYTGEPNLGYFILK